MNALKTSKQRPRVDFGQNIYKLFTRLVGPWFMKAMFDIVVSSQYSATVTTLLLCLVLQRLAHCKLNMY